MAEPWKKYQGTSQPLVINGPPREPPMQAPAEAELTQGHIAQLPLQTEQMRAQTESTRANMAQIPIQNANMRTNIDQGQTSIRTSLQGAEQQLRDDFEKRPEVQQYRVILPQYAAAIRAADNKAGDLQLVYAFGKVMDPGSVVREGETQMASEVGGVSDRMQGYFAQLQGGGRLTPQQRHELISEIHNRGSQIADMYNQTRSQYEGLARQHGFTPDAIIGPHPGAQYQQAEADFLGRPIHNLDGSQGATPRGFQPTPISADMLRSDPLSNLPPAPAPLLPYVLEHPEKLVPPSGQQFDRWVVQHDEKGKPYAVPTFSIIDVSGERGASSTLGKLGERADAAVRGVADTLTLGGADVLEAAGNTLFGDGTMRNNLAHQYAISDYDTQNHFPTRLGGQLVGGVLLPTGEISGMADLAKVGGGYGAAYGFGSARGGIGDRIIGGVEGGIAGAATGPALSVSGKGLAAVARSLRRTPPPMLPLVDQATGRLNAPLQGASPAQRMAAAKQYGIDLPLDAATDKGGAIIGKGLDILPASAGVMNDSRRTLSGQVDNAVNNVAGRYGQAESLYAGGDAAQRGARNWIGRFEDVSSKAYNAIPVSDKAPAVTASTKATLEQLTTAFESNPKLADQMRNPTLVRYLDALNSGGLSWKDLKALRSHIGDQIGEERFSDSPSRGQLRSLYGALSDDMRATAASQGPRALHAFERANTLYAAGQQRIEGALVRILGDNSKNNPEAAAAAIQTIAKSGRGSANIQQLQQIRASLAKGDEWNEVASSLIRLMGQPANSAGRDFDPQAFVRNYADMSEPARNLLFGDRGRADLRRALDGFVAVNQRLAGTNAMRNTSNTALGMMGSGTVLTAGAGLLNPVLGAKVAGGMAANYGMAKLWTNPNFVRWATGYTRLVATGNQNAVRSQIGRLSSLAAREPQLQEPLVALQQRLLGSANDNFGFSATASGPDDQQRRQQR